MRWAGATVCSSSAAAPCADGARLYADFYEGSAVDAVERLMRAAHDGRGVDSATVVPWDVAAVPPMRPCG